MPTFGTALFGSVIFGVAGGGGGTGCGQFDLTTLVKTIINETGSGVFWPDTMVADAINEAVMEFEPIAYYPTTNTTLVLSSGADLVAWPNTVLAWPHYLEYNGQTYFPTTHAQLERYDRNWRTTTFDQPRLFVLWDEQHLRPYPRPDQDYTFNIWGPAWPTEISTDTTDLTVPDLLKIAMAFRAAARLFEYTRSDLADAYMNEAENYEALYRKQWRRNQSHNIKRFRPGTAFTNAQAGSVRIAKRLDGNNANPYAP